MASSQDIYENEATRARYNAYSRLQAAAVAFGETLPIPEIVAIGGQSDGKSSLLEAFLGFRFNVREVEMGTRRPLTLQMVHDPSALEPRCRLQEEDSDEYGEPIQPASAVAEAIRDRTEAHLRRLGGATVSSKPIVMRAEYAFCPNLTIVDTPGFIMKARKGEKESTPNDIMEMVKEQCAPSHRIILFLQQSSVEWCSSLWMHVVQEVDPTFRRTIVVASKFDNRLKEFETKWEVDRYLSAAGYLNAAVRPFFVALPKDRVITNSQDFRAQIMETDRQTLRKLREDVEGGFDEEQYGDRIGFRNLKVYLESELQRRYRDAAPATLALLDERCGQLESQLGEASRRLDAAGDVAALRRIAMQHVAALSGHVQQLLDGATDPDPAQHGMSTEEERAACGSKQWPGVSQAVRPANAGLRLYGGAAFERALDEFQVAAHVLSFPPVAREKVANVLLAHRGIGATGGNVAAAAAEDIARSAARAWLAPLLDSACERLAHVLRRLFDLAAERMAAHPSSDHLSAYIAFHASLRRSHDAFVQGLQRRCKELVKHHLETATSAFAFQAHPGGMAPPPPVPARGAAAAPWAAGGEDDLENCPPPSQSAAQAAAARHAARRADDDDDDDDAEPKEPLRESQMTVPDTPSPEQVDYVARRSEMAAAAGRTPASPAHKRPAKVARGGAATSATDQKSCTIGTYTEVCSSAMELFGRIREAVASHAVPATLKAGFLTPMRNELSASLSVDLFACTDEDFMALFTAAGTLEAMEASKAGLQDKLTGLTKCKSEFQSLARAL